MVEVTDKAAEAFRRIMASAEPDITGLRVMVIAGGCAGYKYRLGFDSQADHGDEVLDFEGFRLFVDRDSGRKLDAARIDYVDRTEGAGFVFDNPQAPRSCNCSSAGSC